MSISPPSDIVLDVARAADPARLQAGLRKLGESSGATFELSLASSAPPPSGSASLGALQERMRPVDPGQGHASRGETYQGLEAFLLQTMIGAMFPQKADQSFGKGLAGDVFKSMLAEQLGTSVAKSGGLGIAKALGARAARQLEEG